MCLPSLFDYVFGSPLRMGNALRSSRPKLPIIAHKKWNPINSFAKNYSIRQVARQTGLSKSSVHRLGQAMASRDRHPESWFWESEEGRRWLIRLVIAVLYT